MPYPARPKNPALARKNDSLSLGEAIERLMLAYQLEAPFKASYIASNWEAIMGKGIAARTQEVYIKNEVLFLRLDSAPLKNELRLNKQRLIDLLNKEVGQTTIKDIHFS